MKLLNNIEVHTYIFYHYTYKLIYVLYDDNAGILEYPVSSPLVDWQLVYVVLTQSMQQSMLHL